MEFFDLVTNVRAMRRLKKDAVPLSLLRKVLGAAVHAPSGQNTQPWSFLVVQDPDDKKFIAKLYKRAAEARTPTGFKIEGNSKTARVLRSFWHQVEHLHEAPVLLLAMGKRDWPFAVPLEKREGPAPPSYGSLYPCVQNILLGCREVGLGTGLTTLHQLFQPELAEHFGIPEDWGIVAMLPIGFPEGNFGPTVRKPAEDVTYFDSFGSREPATWSGVDATA